MMGEFMARQIIKQYNVAIEKGREKYRVYFIKNAAIYKQYQDDCNSILEFKGYGDCIVSE